MNTLPSAPEYLTQIVNGGGYTTELILINTASSDSNVQGNFYNDSGQQQTSPFP